MNFWPFTRPPREVRLSRLRRDVSRLDVELVDLREDFEKLMAAVKRIQGKTYRRKRADMADAIQLEAPPDGGEPIQPPAAPDGGPQLAPNPVFDRRAELLRRAAQLRGR